MRASNTRGNVEMLTKGINMRNAMMMSATLGGLLLISGPSWAEPNNATNVVSRIETEKMRLERPFLSKQIRRRTTPYFD